ncbi:DUF1707 SHOCT-like domain-containing protein [Actinoalloteichus hymeniacidonis]|uniref:DUF1707 SHOCT-like domain-containing protein n=1 Tax=Actinoalloteichus hymeniacidonis TaxID=340345 RepID=UPI00085341DC|nr:DUF1707 domain-containing protein [Actinoalloteichus hymeniacidonis]MBB5910538.1 hypothetical protein [Actinoalloteichus hymeniacidonis]
MSEPQSRDDLRASDVDRQRVVDRLSAAQAEGRLTLAELDERTRAVWQARTYGELGKATEDLPAVPQVITPMTSTAEPVVAENGESAELAAAREQRKREVAAWAAVSLVNLSVWLVIGIAGSWVYPWWLWVAGPWGAALVFKWINGGGSGSTSHGWRH